MSSLNAKSRASFYEWLENIDADDLQNFVFSNRISRNEFKSNNFRLYYAGVRQTLPHPKSFHYTFLSVTSRISRTGG